MNSDEIKKQAYELSQYANAMLQDLENRIQIERNDHRKQIDDLNSLALQKENELVKKDDQIEMKNGEVQKLKRKIEDINDLLNTVKKMCEEVG